MARTVLFLCALFFSISVIAQPSERRMSPEEYILRFKDDAIKEMLLHGVPASITLAQGMLETGNGNSALAVYANNHFGIKCHAEWTGLTYVQDDDTIDECFRKYSTVLESYSDHSLFLKTRDRYEFLFSLQITDYKGWAYGLKAAGYATDPTYASRLISLIETHKLYEYDKMTMVPVEKDNEEHLKNYPPMNTKAGLKIQYISGRKYVVARKGDTYDAIAKELDVKPGMLLRFNDTQSANLEPGEYVYIQPKRNKSDQEKTHTVKKGDTMRSISQQYCIKLSSLYKLNGLNPGTQPKAGQVIYLRKKK